VSRRWLFLSICLSLVGGYTNASPDVLLPIGQEMQDRVKARFLAAGVTYPPERIQLLALKESRRVELWAWKDTRWQHVHDYPVFAASGQAGPKLREGDKQVPEGFYRIEALNPNSNFHLSLKLDFPNPYDWLNASAEGRHAPGSNIFIHGSAWSTGCLAMGNQGVEELFTLAALLGEDRVQVVIAPHDFRTRPPLGSNRQPAWVRELYSYIYAHLRQFPLARKQKGCEPDCNVPSNRLTYTTGDENFP